jgi:hypothetical protein
MCRLANAAFLSNGFARRPSLRNPLGLPPMQRRLIQWLFDLGGTKNRQHHFSNRANTTFAHQTLKRMPNGAVVWVKWGLKHEKWQ